MQCSWVSFEEMMGYFSPVDSFPLLLLEEVVEGLLFVVFQGEVEHTPYLCLLTV